MLRFSAHQRRVTALTLLVMFLNVFVGQAYCASMDLAPAAHSHAPGTPAHEHAPAPAAHSHAPGTPAHEHEPAHEHGPAHKHETAATHSHAPVTAQHEHLKDSAAPAHKAAKRAADCCSDDAASVIASLAHPTKFSLEKPAGTWLALLPATSVLLPRFTNYDRTQAVVLVRSEYLKPKIPDIRIFIGSLTI